MIRTGNSFGLTGASLGTSAPRYTFVESSHRADFKLLLTCNAVTLYKNRAVDFAGVCYVK